VRKPLYVPTKGGSKLSLIQQRRMEQVGNRANFCTEFLNQSGTVVHQELLTIGNSIVGDQAESPTPSFVGKVMQLRASSFYISSLNIDLA